MTDAEQKLNDLVNKLVARGVSLQWDDKAQEWYVYIPPKVITIKEKPA